jgi:hypothetical protein
LQQPCQHGRLFRPQVFRLAVEVMQRCRAQAILVVAKIGVGEIAFEDLVLGQPCLQPEGDQRLACLAGQRLLAGQKRELGELLGNGGATAHAGPRRTGNAARIDAPMAVEPPVLDGEKRLDDVRRQVCHVHRITHCCAIAGNGRAVAGQQGDFRRDDRLQRFGQRRSDRKVAHQHDQQRQCGSDPSHGPPQLAPAWLALGRRGRLIVGWRLE